MGNILKFKKTFRSYVRKTSEKRRRYDERCYL
nr:MAG TPA: hypothetical protein [Caudoviricetes sp.]